ncbi:MAG: (deoxy)nucleoside triphosphate pyrophosphohydrolase [Erysipelotrichaceae bacterium]
MKQLDIVCGAIAHNGLYLIAKRGPGVGEGIWEFPGGKVEANETREEAIVRELKEELDVSVEVKQAMGMVVDTQQGIELHVYGFLCTLLAGEAKASVHSEVLWVSAQELSAYRFQEADTLFIEYIKQQGDKV